MKGPNLIRAGWWALHQAALNYGAEIDYFPPDYPELRNRIFLDPESYTAHVYPMVEVAGFDLENLGRRADVIRWAIWRNLKKRGNTTQKQLWRLLNEGGLIGSPITEFASSKYFRRRGAPDLNPELMPSVARYGHWLLVNTNLEKAGFLAELMWGLALLGWAALNWRDSGQCELCFRRSWSGRRFCDEHSQSMTTRANRSEAYQRYRIGRKAHALARERGQLEFLQGDNISIHKTRHLLLPGVLFDCFLSPDEIEYELDLIRHALNQSPRVLKLIGGSKAMTLDFEKSVNCLRKKLDRHEWSFNVWGLTIIRAELWLALENEVAPGQRGGGKKTQERIALALQLAAQGLTKSQIAAELGISPSAVSKWIVRGIVPVGDLMPEAT